MTIVPISGARRVIDRVDRGVDAQLYVFARQPGRNRLTDDEAYRAAVLDPAMTRPDATAIDRNRDDR